MLELKKVTVKAEEKAHICLPCYCLPYYACEPYIIRPCQPDFADPY